MSPFKNKESWWFPKESTAFIQCVAQATKLDSERQIIVNQNEFRSQFTSEPRVVPARNLEAAEAPSVVPNKASTEHKDDRP